MLLIQKLIDDRKNMSVDSLLYRIKSSLREQSSLTIHDTLVPMAILLYLRWLDHYETEREAATRSEGVPFHPSIPPDLRWEAFHKLQGTELSHHIKELMLPEAVGEFGTPESERYISEVVVPKISLIRAGAFSYQIEHMAMSWPKLLRLPENLVHELVKIVDELPFERLEDRQLGEQLLGAMIREGATRRSAFYMPEAAAELMVEVAKPRLGERIYDPCYGSGSLLVAVSHHLQKEAQFSPGSQWEGVQANTIFGVDHYADYWFVGMVRITLSGVDHPALELGDVLVRPRLRNPGREGFDCILATPPWRSLDRSPRSANFDIPTTSSEGLFIQHIATSLRPGGRAVVALPVGFLFSAGSEKRVRKMLLEDFRVEGVIGLPPNVFKPYTAAQSCLLVFQRSKPVNSVRFLSVEAMSGVGKAADRLNSQTPAQIAEAFQSSKVSRNTWVVPISAIASREWDLSPRRTGADELDSLLKEIEYLDQSISIVVLEKVAELIPGANYTREDVVEDLTIAVRKAALGFVSFVQDKEIKEDNIQLVPLVRVGDIAKGNVNKPALKLINQGVLQGWKRGPIQKNDILISVGGTIGKIGIASQEVYGAVAARNVTVIRPHSPVIQERYLIAILQSNAYQSWLSGHARGTVIQNLSNRVLRTLKLPIPELQIQKKVIEAVAKSGVDAVEELLRLIRMEEINPINRWLESTNISQYSRISSLGDEKTAAASIIRLEELARSFCRLRDEWAHDVSLYIPSEWVIAAWSGSEMLKGISQVPIGNSRLSILERAKSSFQIAKSDLSKLSNESKDRAMVFCLTMLELIEVLIEEILSDIRIVATLGLSEIPREGTTELILLLRNNSASLLRNFRAKTINCIGSVSEDLFESDKSRDMVILIKDPQGDQFNFTVVWTAIRLDGRKVDGEIPLSVKVIQNPASVKHVFEQASFVSHSRRVRHSPSSLDHKPDFDEEASVSNSIRVEATANFSEDISEDSSPNPYVTGTPITRPEMFFGRKEVVESIKRHLGSKSQRNVILLEGNRRAGKSSILFQLERPEVLPQWVVARCDFQGAAGDDKLPGIPTTRIFSHLAQQIADAGQKYQLHFWPPAQPAYDTSKPYLMEFRRAFASAIKELPAFEAFKEFLESVITAITPKRLLLMLDEFDRIQEGIDSGVTSSQVPQNIRFILNNYPEVTAILTGSRRMTQMRKEYWSVLFGLGHKINVTSIDPEEARKLVTQPVQGHLVYPPAAVDRVINLCACQPFLIQRLCSQIFDACINRCQSSITMNMVEDAALQLVSGMEHFEAFWEFAGSERARYVLCIINRLTQAEDAAPVTLPMIEDELNQAGILYKRDELVGDELKKLVELEMVGMEKNGQYQLAVPLLSLWISRNKDYEDQRERAVQESTSRSF